MFTGVIGTPTYRSGIVKSLNKTVSPNAKSRVCVFSISGSGEILDA
jgi:hypothetical protein